MPFVPISDARPLVPTAYLHTLDDLSVPCRVQKHVLEKYTSSFSEVIQVQSGHLWMIDQPGKSVEGLAMFAASLRA